MALLEIKTGRLFCEVCKATIGQVDDHNEAGQGMIELNHFAPCGLPCMCEGADRNWLAENAKAIHGGLIAQVHRGNKMGECPICQPQKCPACDGKAIKFKPYSIAVTMRAPSICERCRGTGIVDGLELYLETADECAS